MNRLRGSLVFLLLATVSLPVAAQTMYITDKLQIGLHAEKTLHSPIVSVIPSGTRLELIKREDDLSYVRDPSGIGGWIDNSYLSENTLASEQLLAAQARIANLEQSLENLGDDSEKSDIPAISEEQMLQLQALLEEEQTRSESLQQQVTEMTNQLAASSQDSLYSKIEQLSTENTQLQSQLAHLLERPATGPLQMTAESISGDESGTGRYILTLFIAAIFGLGLGIYIMDLTNRRRHGGFRVRV